MTARAPSETSVALLSRHSVQDDRPAPSAWQITRVALILWLLAIGVVLVLRGM